MPTPTAPGDLLTTDEIAAMIGLTPASARTLHQRATRNRREGKPGERDMPEPDARFGRTPVWTRATVEAWKRARS